MSVVVIVLFDLGRNVCIKCIIIKKKSIESNFAKIQEFLPIVKDGSKCDFVNCIDPFKSFTKDTTQI